MEYKGKLYGRIGSKYFDTGKTSEDWDALEKQTAELKAEIEMLKSKLRFDAITLLPEKDAEIDRLKAELRNTKKGFDVLKKINAKLIKQDNTLHSIASKMAEELGVTIGLKRSQALSEWQEFNNTKTE